MSKSTNSFLEQLRRTIGEAETTNEVELLRSGGLRLYPYQQDAVDFLRNKVSMGRGILGDEMGLGKTLEALATVKDADPNNQMKVLVVTPKSAKAVWKQEIKKWLDEDAEIVDSQKGYNYCSGQFLMPRKRFLVCNYEQVR